MSLFRKVHTEFWRDPRVLEELTPEDKLFFLYLLTNPNTTQIGIYKITKKQIAFELGYSIESVNTLVDRFENNYKFIKYNNETRELAIKMWGKYNLNRGGKPIIDCIEKELKEVKDISLVEYIAGSIEKDEIKSVLLRYINKNNNLDNDTYHDTLQNIGQEEDKEKDKEIEKDKDKDDKLKINIGEYAKLYEQNIGLINGVVGEWLVGISEDIDVNLFKRAIEIATDKGKCSKGYVAGIIKKWGDNNIKTINDLKAYDIGSKSRGKDLNVCDEGLYRKPTKEQLDEVRRMFEGA